MKKKDPKQIAFFVGGCIAAGLAIVGVMIPVVPQVPFAVAAAFLFSKSSPRLHKWIRNNKHMGRPVRDWEDHKVVRPRLKAFSTAAMVGGAVIAHFTLDTLWVAIALDVVFAASIVFVLTRHSRAPAKKR